MGRMNRGPRTLVRARPARHTPPGFYPRSVEMALRCAILDDYQNVALKLADWSKIKEVETKVYTDAVRRTEADTIRDCKDCEIVVMMRERTRFPRAVIEGLPELKLLITTGAYNASIDMKACRERGITVCGTTSH